MRKKRFPALGIAIGALVGLIGFTVNLTAAQNTPPYVVFIEEPGFLQMSSLTDPGPDGLTRLAETFRAYGASTGFLPLDQPIPEEADVLVLVRPRSPLPGNFLARIYAALERGTHLLIALDPLFHTGARPDGETSGLSTLLGADYGVSLLDVFLVEPNFTGDSVQRLDTSFSQAFPSPVVSEVVAPLRQFDLPVRLWGSRALMVSAITTQSYGFPLLIAEPEYGERDPNFFLTSTPPPEPTAEDAPTATPLPPDVRPTPVPLPIGYQIGLDLTGQFNVGALGVNRDSGSRIAVFADGELFQNGYGLGLSSTNGLPINVGNRILVDRTVGWLLGAVPEEYLPLPVGFTFIAIDGDGGDWLGGFSTTGDRADDTSILGLDIRDVRGFRNAHYVYLRIDTAGVADSGALLTLELDNNFDGTAETRITARQGEVTLERDGESMPIPDAAFAAASVIELRLPVREAGEISQITNLCLQSGMELVFPPPPDCIDEPVNFRFRDESDPVPLRLPGDLLLIPFTTEVVNIRSAASANSSIVATAGDRELFRVIGRSENGEWLLVENAAMRGWINAIVGRVNGDTSALPVIEDAEA